jgi:putative FmdB family regulatory protein
MPIYDFRCRTCGHEFEALVRPQDASQPACVSCQGRDLEKLLSGFAVSSAEKTQAAAKKSRQSQIRANKDKVVADEEYRKEHEGH